MAHSQVPKFGGWESQENTDYTVRFDAVRRGDPGPVKNPYDDIQPDESKPKQKEPEFGDWNEEEEEVQWTQHFERKGKARASPPREPEINYNVGPKLQPTSEYKRPIKDGESRATTFGVKFVEGKNNVGGKGRGGHVAPRKKPQATPYKDGGGATVPPFSGWVSNPSDAENYTGYFEKVRDERKGGGASGVKATPSHSNYSPAQKQPTQGGFCAWLRSLCG